MAPANAASTTSVTSVRRQLMYNSAPSATTAVTMPPSSCTRPVPTRLRMPSGSFITREISTPVCVVSK